MVHRPWTDAERKLILAKGIQSGIDTAFKNHTYWFHSELYCQKNGNAIGALLTRLVIVGESRVAVYLFYKYIKDVNLVTTFLPKG